MSEKLDDVARGVRTSHQLALALMRWTRRQWEPGRPDPYPPPQAETILSEIRGHRTSGFCAQYCFILSQAVQSFGLHARGVTVVDHEVIEVYLPEESRWVMFDPLYETEVSNLEGQALSAYEIGSAVRNTLVLRLKSDRVMPEPMAAYLKRFLRLGFWLRNDFVTNPMNFVDFPRYIVWFVPDKRSQDGVGPDDLTTSRIDDLYPAIQLFSGIESQERR